MEPNTPIPIEMYYTFTCPNCIFLSRMLDEVLPEFGDKFVLHKRHANAPLNMIRTMQLGIHAVPTLLIDHKVVFRSVPKKEDLIAKLSSY